MRLYAGSSTQFIEDAVQNQIAEKLKRSFFSHFRYNPPDSEVRSWRNSLRAISQVFDYAELIDHGVILEYQLPLNSKRLDCLICGRDSKGSDNAVIIELKQWEKSRPAIGDNELMSYVGHAEREMLHPSAQVGGYCTYLADVHTAFHAGSNPVGLSACAYLHNYNYVDEDPLKDPKFNRIMQAYPVFTADDVIELVGYLQPRMKKGEGLEVLQRIEESRYRPSKKLMDHVSNIIKNKKEYVLLDEQRVVYDRVLAEARQGFHRKEKVAIIVKGGPGTGKSVIAINLMADLLAAGYNAHYATGSRAFTTTLRKIIGTRGSVQFKYFNSYVEAEPDVVDVLIADEAHRMRATSNARWTPRKKRNNTPQVDELLRASRVSVFFIDDLQIVRSDEIGSSGYIRETAEKQGVKALEYQLEVQFRCRGSDAFVNWINNTLGLMRTANVIWEGNEHFDFRIMESPESVEQAIRAKITEVSTGRVVAGYCWKWSDPLPDGTLVEDDVVIGNYKRAWNTKPGSTRLARNVPRVGLWAYDPNGINQVGCIYTMQGFEADYVGVIFGKDLKYDLDTQEWEGHPEESHDSNLKRSKERFVDLAKNVYRVLLTRGMVGCYVYFMDKDTERFFRSRMELLVATNQ